MDNPVPISKQKIVAFSALLILLLAIPVTILVFQQRQKLRSGAATPPPEVCHNTTDIALVIDMSSSMNERMPSGMTKKDAVIQAAGKFLDAMDLDSSDGKADRVAIVQFNAEAKIVRDLTSDRSSLNSALAAMDTTEYTDIAAGLIKGAEALKNASQPKNIILLSDGKMNVPLNHPRRNDMLPYLAESATNVRSQGVAISAINFNTKIYSPTCDPISDLDCAGYRVLRDLVVNSPVDLHLYSATLDIEALTKAFLDVAGLLTACPCPFTADERVELVTNKGTPYSINSNQFFGTSGSDSYDFYDVSVDKPNAGQRKASYFASWGLPATVGTDGVTRVTDDYKKKASEITVSLDEIPANYEVVEKFCTDNNPAVKVCPSEFSLLKVLAVNPGVTPTQPHGTKPDAPAFKGFNFACEGNVTYGWRIKPKACAFNVVAQVKDTAGNLLTSTKLFKTQAITNGSPSSNFTELYDSKNQTQTTFSGSDQGAIQSLIDAASISVKLLAEANTTPGLKSATDYDVVGTFCTGATGCPTNTAAVGVKPKNDPSLMTLDNFKFSCGMDITYGWIVDKKNGPPVCQLDVTDVVADEGKVTATFDGSKSSDPDGDALTYKWTFTDGFSAGNVPSIRHETTIDNTKASLVVCDPSNTCSTNLCEQTVRIGAVNLEPICRITSKPSPAEGKVPLTVEFDGSGSVDPEGKPLTYSWRFSSDGSTATTSKVSKTFSSVVNGTATLTVTDEKGKSKVCELPYKTTTAAKDYYDCDYDKEQCVLKTAPDGNIPPGAVDCQNNNALCERHYECTPQKTCQLVGGAGEDECSKDKDCLKTYNVCDKGACVEVYGDKADQCNPSIPNVCAPPPEPPDTGVSGAAFATTILVTILFVLGLKLLY